MTDEPRLLVPQRLRDLRKAEEEWVEARAVVIAVTDETQDVVDQYHWALRVALDLRADNKATGLERDLELEDAGTVALEARRRATSAAVTRRQALRTVVTTMVREGHFEIGDAVLSPVRPIVLTVAEIARPDMEPELSEVTLTADGGLIEKRLHSWPLDGDGTPITDDDVPIRFERWWGGGLRAAGSVHPLTRQIVATD